MIQNKALSWRTPVIFLLLAPIVAAQATVDLVQNFNLDSIETILGPTDSDTQVSGLELFLSSVDQFDPSLGTLESFTLEVDVSFSAAGTADSGGGGLDFGYSASFFANGELITSAGEGSGAGGDSNEMFNGTGDFDVLFTDLPTALEDTVVGTGTFEFFFRGSSDVRIFGVSDVTMDFDGGTVSWTYTYTPVPEPQSFGFMAGFLALCWLGVRRKGRLLSRVL